MTWILVRNRNVEGAPKVLWTDSYDMEKNVLGVVA